MQNPPETPGAVQVRLAYYRNRKAALDELISCLEHYVACHSPAPRNPPRPEAEDRSGDFVGAA